MQIIQKDTRKNVKESNTYSTLTYTSDRKAWRTNIGHNTIGYNTLNYLNTFFGKNSHINPVDELISSVFKFKGLQSDWDSYSAEKTSVDNNINPVIELVNSVFRFKELQPDWDSYGAEKISIDSIVTAIKIIRLFESNSLNIEYAFPMRDGGVQLEMNFKNHPIELEIYNEENINLLIFDKLNNLVFEKNYNSKNIENLLPDLINYGG